MTDSGAIHRGGLRGFARKPERGPRPWRQVERGRRVIAPAVDRIGRIAGVEKFILGKSALEEKSAVMHRAWSLRGAIGRIGRRRKAIVGGIVEHHQHVAFGIGLDLGIKCGASAIVALAGGTGPANLVQDARGDNLRTSVLEGARASRIIVVIEDRPNLEPQEMRRAGAGSGAVGVDRGIERSRGVDGLTRNASVAGID